jgi:undecaprenyl-diphosphatase
MVIYLISFILLALGLAYDNVIANFFYVHQYLGLSNFFTIFAVMGNGIAVLILVTLYWIVTRKKLPIPFWLAFGISMFIIYALKLIVMRDRPFAMPGTLDMESSFSSGHSTAVFSALPFMTKSKEKYVWLIFAVLVVISRLYQGYHYLTDVVAGMLIGYTTGILIEKYAGKKLEKIGDKLTSRFMAK